MTQMSSLDEAQLHAAEAACALFIRRGTTDIPIADLVVEMGISHRTFHRYFPNKADVVGPVFAWTTRVFNDAVASQPLGTSVLDACIAAYRESLAGDLNERTRGLFPLVFQDPAMWSVFLRHVHNGERTLAPVLAPHLGLTPESNAVRAAAAAVASSTRIALEDMSSSGADPLTRYGELLRAFKLESLGSQ